MSKYKCLAILTFLVFFCGCGSLVCRAQDTLTIYFPLNRYTYDPSYMGNASTMEKLLKMDDIKTIKCRVTSSPEGAESRNNFLSRKRAESITNWLHKNSNVLSNAFEIISADEAWDELKALVLRCDKAWREDVLQMLEIEPVAQRKAALQRYDGGQVWEWMKANWFPLLRQSLVIIKTKFDRELVCIAKVEAPATQTFAVQMPPLAGIEFLPQTGGENLNQGPTVPQSPTREWIPQIGLKINAIGLAMGHGNIAAEFDFAEHWSVAIPFYYSGGFDYFKPTIKFRGIVVQPEVRYYFAGGKRNSGFFIGVHGGIGWYNYALDGEFRIQDHKGTTPAYGGGVGLGYAFNFKRAPRWGMELAIGAGAYKAKYDILYNEHNGPYSEYGVEKLFIGVDNASVAVTYDFSLNKNCSKSVKKNHNKKGGRR